MASPYPRLTFDRADQRLLTSIAATASVFATLMGILAWTSPPPTGYRQDPPSFVRWMQLLGTPKNLRHARVLLESELAAAVTSIDAVTRVRAERVTTAISEVSGHWSRATWHRAVRARVTLLRWCLPNGPPRQHADESVHVTLTADAAGRIHEGVFNTSPSRLSRCVRGNISPAVLPVRGGAARSRSRQHGRATLTVSVSATEPRR